MGYIGLVVLAMVVAASGEALRAHALRISWQDTARVTAWYEAGTSLIAAGLTALAVALLFFFRDYVYIWMR